MQNQYATLETLARIVEHAVHPSQFAVTTREMILHSKLGWEEIYTHLQSLSQEGLVTISSGDTIQFCITDAGLERVNDMVMAK